MKLFDKLISNLGKRQFILQSARAKEPQVFTSRWSMSYLAGPLDRNQIERLTRDHPARRAFKDDSQARTSVEISGDESQVAPRVDSSAAVYYLDPAAPWASQVRAVPAGRRLQAGLIARVHLTYDDSKAGIDHTEEWEAVFFPLSERFDPGTAIDVDYDDRDLDQRPPDGAVYMLPKADLEKASFFKEMKRSLRDHLVRNRSMRILRNSDLGLFSRVGESRNDFEGRCQKAAEDKADSEMAKLKEKS